MTSPRKGTHATSHNPDKVLIVKSGSVESSFSQLTLKEADPNNSEELIKAYFNPIDENAFTTLLPLKYNAIERKGNLDYNSCIQPIVFEFDVGSIEFQMERIEAVKDHFHIPQFFVHSGNKSIHHYLWFQHFADDHDMYVKAWEKLYKYLSEIFPKYYKYVSKTPEGNKDRLVADTKMKSPHMYCRQAKGIRDNGEFQKATYYNQIDNGFIPASINVYIDKIQLGGSLENEPKTPSVFHIAGDFLSSGAKKGSRDEACFKSASLLRDCGYSKEEAFILLKKGADKCEPVFPHDDVAVKVKSAYGYKRNPFAFIEATTSAYHYFYGGKLFATTKDILRETFRSFDTGLPEKYPILEFKFDMNDNLQIDLSKRTFNLFRPTKYHLMGGNDRKLIPKEHFGEIQRLLKNLIPKKKERNYFINWLAVILQTRNKLMTSFVFIGEQGAGKGVFLGHILKPLFGDNQTIQVEDEQLKSSFNGWIKNVAFIAFNEVAHDNRGRNSLNSKIKSIITDPSITVNEKNIRTYQLNNNINCIFYSNEKVPLLVERSDRRFTIMETGGNLANKKWFKVPGSFKKFQKELPEFAQYLWNYDVNMKEANKPFSTDLKDVLISAGQSRWEEFVHHLKDGDKVWFQEMTQDIKSFYLTGLFNDKPKFSSAQHVSLDWDQIKKEKYLTKDQALRLFQELYRDKGITKNSLSRHLAPFGFRVQRKGTGDDRMQYYDWN